MPPPASTRTDPTVLDVVICGGGLAGLLLARQLHQEFPGQTITVVERVPRPLPDACHKVGESSVEIASQYLERLGLADYLRERQIYKLGLRFFPGGGHLPLHERSELGPCAEPIVHSYQLDRGRLENDLRDMLEAEGVALLEGYKVRKIDLGADDAPHVIVIEAGDHTRELRARWVVDATGRSALIRRGLKLTRSARHDASAAWFRIAGRFDINDLVPRSETGWHARPCAAERWRSTNHFMGPGYWAWVIPLATGNTSIGLVIHEELHDFMNIAGLDHMLAFLRKHEPHLASALESQEIKDFLCLRKYAHTVARAWSEERWALVGEAGAFVDPLYSPGSDFIAFANCFTTEMIRIDLAGASREERKAKAGMLSAQYRALVAGTLNLFRVAAPVYGHPSAMAAKIYCDNFSYWSFTCHYFQQDLCRLSMADYAPFGEVGRRFLELSFHVQDLLRAWAELAPESQRPVFIPAPAFPSVLVDAHIQVGRRMQQQEALDYMRMRLRQGEEIVGEVVLRVVQILGPALAQELLERVRFSLWEVRIAPERLELETLAGRARRHRLSEIARDVERTLGPVRRHPDAGEARNLLALGTLS
jgi:flavin-dependent dehydrogenase